MANFDGELISLGLIEDVMVGEVLSLLQEGPMLGEQLPLCTPGD